MMSRWGYRSKYDVSEWKPPKINYDKGKRPILPKIKVDYSFTREELSKLKKKYDTKNNGFNLWWPRYRLDRTVSLPNPSTKPTIQPTDSDDTKTNDKPSIKQLKPKAQSRRPHSARYSRHYLEENNESQRKQSLWSWSQKVNRKKRSSMKIRKKITMNDINYGEMELLCYGYVHETAGDLLEDVIKLILEKCEVIPTFDGYQSRKIQRRAAGTMTSMCGNIFRKIKCGNDNGYISGVRYLSINFTRGGCTNHFGITNKDEYVERWSDTFPELLKSREVKNYKMAFRDYNLGGTPGIITVKLDCDKWTVTFYKNFKAVLKHEKIKENTPYWFYMYYCNRASQLFEIVRTDVLELEKNCKKKEEKS